MFDRFKGISAPVNNSITQHLSLSVSWVAILDLGPLNLATDMGALRMRTQQDGMRGATTGTHPQNVAPGALMNVTGARNIAAEVMTRNGEIETEATVASGRNGEPRRSSIFIGHRLTFSQPETGGKGRAEG